MKAKRYIPAIMFCCIVLTANAKIVRDSLYEIPKTKIPPVIDGIQDAVWKTLDWNFQRHYTVDGIHADSGAGLTGMHKAMWDSENLYILFYSIDDKIVDIAENAPWNQDAIEIYIEPTNDKIGPCPGGDCEADPKVVLEIPHKFKGVEDSNITNIGLQWPYKSDGVKYRIRDIANTEGFPGWILEMKIPLANIGIDGSIAYGHLIGWELQQDECDDSTTGRQSMSKWWSSSNNSWTDVRIWGTAVLSSREVDSTLVINKTNATITIDGVLDQVYKWAANPVTTNLFRVGDPPGADAADTDPLNSFITAYPLYDADNFYVFFDVNDAVITNIPANAVWNQDAVEMYIDSDNSKTKDGVSPDPGGGLAHGDVQVTFPNWFKGTEDGRLNQIGLPAGVDTTGFAFKITDKPEGGYYLELKMAWAGLGVDPYYEALIGFEVQLDNSNDASIGRQGIQKWWHNSNNSWTDASLWGTALLRPPCIDCEPYSVATEIKLNEYNLSQNYPNPFNPLTTIKYQVPTRENVSLKIVDLLGREIATLVNEEKQPGDYEVQWNASNVTSGLYFYRLHAGNFVETKKMILLR